MLDFRTSGSSSDVLFHSAEFTPPLADEWLPASVHVDPVVGHVIAFSTSGRPFRRAVRTVDKLSDGEATSGNRVRPRARQLTPVGHI